LQTENKKKEKQITELMREKDDLQNKKPSFTLSEFKTMLLRQLQKDKDFQNFVKKELQKYEPSPTSFSHPVSSPATQELKLSAISKQPEIVVKITDKCENGNILYAEFINNGEFQNIEEGQPSDMSVFELRLTGGGKTASFQIYEGAKERVIARTNHLAGCEKDIAPGGTTLTQTAGTAYESGGKWKVDSPLKVKIV
jgi:hypothetical protein